MTREEVARFAVAFCLKAADLHRQGITGPRRQAVRRRLVLIEQTCQAFSLRPERGKARRGELREADPSLALLDELGISARWVLHGDLDALLGRALNLIHDDGDQIPA